MQLQRPIVALLLLPFLFVTQALKLSYKCGHNRLALRRHLIDPFADTANVIAASTAIPSSHDGISEGLEAFQNSFLKTFSFRLLGTIAGTFIAGLAFTALSGFAVASIGKKADQSFMNLFPSSSSSSSSKSSSSISSTSSSSAVKEKGAASTEDGISREAWLKLALCIAIDLLGDVSYVLPGIGEAEDAVWSPISAFVLNQLFGNNAITSIEFVLQALPFTDFVPVATLAWLLQNIWKDNQLARGLGLNKRRK